MTFKECMGKVGEFFKKCWQAILIPIGFVAVVLMTRGNRKSVSGEIKQLKKEIKEDQETLDADIAAVEKLEAELEQVKKEVAERKAELDKYGRYEDAVLDRAEEAARDLKVAEQRREEKASKFMR